MAVYVSTPGDVEIGDEERPVIMGKKTGWMWKMFTTTLTVAVCIGGVLLLSWYWNGTAQMVTEPAQTEARIQRRPANETDDHQHHLRRISSKAMAAIHLEGRYDDGDLELEWRNGQGQAFAQGGLRLENNQIVVPQSGLYFVYSQASFRVSCSDDDDEGTGKGVTLLSHRIWCYSDSVGKKTSLMSAVRSACQHTGQDDSYRLEQDWYNTIYLGAVFRLNEGDKLWTETNQLPELETDEGKTFFGVFAL